MPDVTVSYDVVVTVKKFIKNVSFKDFPRLKFKFLSIQDFQF